MHSRVELSFISTGVSASAGSEVNRADRLKSEADRVDRVVSILSPGLVNLPLLQSLSRVFIWNCRIFLKTEGVIKKYIYICCSYSKAMKYVFDTLHCL